MASISSIGVGSGIDLEGLVEQILSAERKPVENRLDLREAEAEASISALGSLKSTLSSFRSALEDLQDSSFFSTRSAVSTNKDLFTATADSGAELGNYNVEVLYQAKAHKLVSNAEFSDPNALIGAGTLTINLGGAEFNFTTDGTTTIDGLRDQINDADIGVRASLLTVDAGLGDGSTVTKFVLTAEDTGASNDLTITVDEGATAIENEDATGLSRLFFSAGDPDNQMTEVDPAQDAQIAVDGFTAYSATNSFSNVIEGVTITVLDEADDVLNPPSGALNVSVDKSKVKAAIETFVASYNELVTVFNALTNYDSASGTSGLFGGDASINAMESRIRRVMSETVEGAASDFNILAYIGIGTNLDGSVALDDADLTDALNNRLDDVAALFSGDNGVATQLDDIVKGLVQSGGVISTMEQGLETRLDSIEEQRLDLEYRLGIIEERYRSKFAALDTLVAQLNETGNFLQEQLSATASIITRDSGDS